MHQASTWGHVRGPEEELCLLPEGHRSALRGHGLGGKRRRGERSLGAAALFKLDAGVALLVSDIGVALLLCFYSGRGDTYVYLLSLIRACFHGFAIGRVLSILYINLNTLQLGDRIFCRNSSLQDVCDTPIARITDCVSSLRI